MKKKISVCVICCAILSSLLTGCANYDDVTKALDSITIQNTLPKVSEDASYYYLEDIDELVYEQQLNACTMYADSYNKTYYQQFADGKRKSDKIAYMCTEKRKTINTDIEIAYAINIYRLLQDVTDCSNPDAYVVKTHKDVLDFYDIYDKYQTGDDPQDALLDILLEYYDRSNILAFTFLRENDTRVFKASLARIEENAASDDDLRIHVSENNLIITALNDIYGGVPDEYSVKISKLNTALAKKLLMSLEGITEDEREKLLLQLEPATPSPSPTTVASPTPKPTESAIPIPTRIPETPKPTATPTTRPTPTSVPSSTVHQTISPSPTEEPYEPIFGLDPETPASEDEDLHEFQ